VAGDDPLVVLIAQDGADETDHCLFGDVFLEAADGIWMLDVLEFLTAECRTARPVRGRSGGWPGRPMAVPATEWSVPTASP
jgi:hypothetical protein